MEALFLRANMLVLRVFSQSLKPASVPGREWPWPNARLQLSGSSLSPGRFPLQLLPLGSVFKNRMRGCRIPCAWKQRWVFPFTSLPQRLQVAAVLPKTLASSGPCTHQLFCCVHCTKHMQVVWKFPEPRRTGKCRSGWSTAGSGQGSGLRASPVIPVRDQRSVRKNRVFIHVRRLTTS